LFVISSPSQASPLSSEAASDLFDQSTLSTLARRLVEAARRAGADAADAVAVRGVSQGVEVRDGRVEESERSESDDSVDGEEITNEIPDIRRSCGGKSAS